MGKIEFVSTIKHLEKLEDCVPRPAKNFIPKWFKDIPSHQDMTVKQCPSFPDYFSQGYVVPMWVDVRLSFNPDSSEYSWKTPMKDVIFDGHTNDQFIKYVQPYFQNSPGQFVFKAVCPWRIITPPGWSVLQLPLFYHFNNEYSVLPGVIDTDIHHEINQQILYHGDGKTIEIKRGQPLALYIPFERSKKLDLEIRSATDNDTEKFETAQLNLFSRFHPSGTYREMQRKRDQKNNE